MNLIERLKWLLRPGYWGNKALNKFGYNLEPTGLDYFNPADILPKAMAAQQTLCEYLESNNIGGIGIRRDLIVETLHGQGVFNNPHRVVEIGAGTGMYTEKTIEIAKPNIYDVFETNRKWVRYLKQAYQSHKPQLVLHAADGKTLRPLADASADLVLSHGVFVYIPVLDTVSYLDESLRVLKPCGMLVFDVFLNTDFDYDTAQKWLSDSYKYTFPVITAESLIEQFAQSNNLDLVHRFRTPYHGTTSTYFVFRKGG